jgi:hypothetical protein
MIPFRMVSATHEFHLPVPAPTFDGITVESTSNQPLQFGDEV